jgi:hypothetical protein
MTQNQSNTAFGTPLKKRIAVGAASVLAAGALLGVGVAGASASPLTPSTPSASASASAHADGQGGPAAVVTVEKQIRQAFFESSVDGAKAQKLAVIAVGQTEFLTELPAKLQADLGTLAKAPSSETTAAAEKISATALSGGYGKEAKSAAENLNSGAKHPLAASLRDALRGATGQDLGQSAEKVASSLIGHPELFAQLPANLQSDLTSIKDAPASEAGAEATKAKDTALSGGYGEQIQKIAEGLLGAAAAK